MNNTLTDNVEQRKFWSGKFGDNYIERNKSIAELNEFYFKQTGFTQEQIFHSFFSDLEKDIKIIELGCNIGLKLSILKKMGFRNLAGVELNKKAFEIAKKINPDISFVNSSIEDYDLKEKFDLAYTSGVLIHINPLTLPQIMKKIVHLSEKYIFGFEYYSDELKEIKYRDESNVCWKQNFPQIFKNLFPELMTIKEQYIPYKDQNLSDIAYLLRK